MFAGLKHVEKTMCFKPYPLVQSPLSYKAQQLVIDQVQVFLPCIDDSDDDIVTDGFLWIMGTHLQEL